MIALLSQQEQRARPHCASNAYPRHRTGTTHGPSGSLHLLPISRLYHRRTDLDLAAAKSTFAPPSLVSMPAPLVASHGQVMASKPAMSRAFTHLLPEMSDKPDAGNQAMIQQHLLKRAAEQQHRAQAVCSHTQIRGMEQVLDFSDATAQLSASSSDTQKQSSPQKQGVAPVTWTTCDPWFVYMVMTVTVGALAFK